MSNAIAPVLHWAMWVWCVLSCSSTLLYASTRDWSGHLSLAQGVCVTYVDICPYICGYIWLLNLFHFICDLPLPVMGSVKTTKTSPKKPSRPTNCDKKSGTKLQAMWWWKWSLCVQVMGRIDTNRLTFFDGGAELIGQIVPVLITDVRSMTLTGRQVA